jgi:hypothetical protein
MTGVDLRWAGGGNHTPREALNDCAHGTKGESRHPLTALALIDYLSLSHIAVACSYSLKATAVRLTPIV